MFSVLSSIQLSTTQYIYYSTPQTTGLLLVHVHVIEQAALACFTYFILFKLISFILNIKINISTSILVEFYQSWRLLEQILDCGLRTGVRLG